MLSSMLQCLQIHLPLSLCKFWHNTPIAFDRDRAANVFSSQDEDAKVCAAGDFCPFQNDRIVGSCPVHKFCPHAVAAVTSKQDNVESLNSVATGLGCSLCHMCNHIYCNWSHHIQTPDHIKWLQAQRDVGVTQVQNANAQ